jgi:quercetin dioxygenase-like cupin family protein
MTNTIPADDPSRQLTIATAEAPDTQYVALAGDVYALLVTGDQTNGQYTLIDMRVPDGGGPPPHRHNFEEMFTVLEGEIEFTFRGETTLAKAGTTVNIPANAPHFFRNASGADARMLCMCTPAGQDEFFLQVGDLVDNFDSPQPDLTEAERDERRARALQLAPQYQTEMLI